MYDVSIRFEKNKMDVFIQSPGGRIMTVYRMAVTDNRMWCCRMPVSRAYDMASVLRKLKWIQYSLFPPSASL